MTTNPDNPRGGGKAAGELDEAIAKIWVWLVASGRKWSITGVECPHPAFTQHRVREQNPDPFFSLLVG